VGQKEFQKKINVRYNYGKNKRKRNSVKGKRHLTGLYMLRPFGARATKNRSRATPFVRFFSATFLRLLERFAFLYRNRKNVIYNQNVMCNAPKFVKVYKKLYT
jgi:hypothetical protein